MKTCFGFMFWGLLLVVLDFNYDHFDLLPDALGYALVAIGTGGLASVTGNFITATSTGWLLTVSSVVGPFLSGDAAIPFGIFISVLNCAMIWTMLGGIRDIAAGRSRLDFAERAEHRRSIYVALLAVTMVLGLFVQGSDGGIGLLALILVVARLIVMALILHLIYRAWTELSP